MRTLAAWWSLFSPLLAVAGLLVGTALLLHARRSWSSALASAYDAGYRHGWNDAMDEEYQSWEPALDADAAREGGPLPDTIVCGQRAAGGDWCAYHGAVGPDDKHCGENADG